MLNVTADEFRTYPEGTLFTYDGADVFVRRAVFEKGVDPQMTSARFSVYGKDDLRKLQSQVEFALGLIGHGRSDEDEEADLDTNVVDGEE